MATLLLDGRVRPGLGGGGRGSQVAESVADAEVKMSVATSGS